MRIECPHCGQVGQFADPDRGKTLTCPGCDKQFRTDGVFPGPAMGRRNFFTKPAGIALIVLLAVVALLIAAFVLYVLVWKEVYLRPVDKNISENQGHRLPLVAHAKPSDSPRRIFSIRSGASSKNFFADSRLRRSISCSSGSMFALT